MPHRAIAAFALFVAAGLLAQAGYAAVLAMAGDGPAPADSWLFLGLAGLIAGAGIAIMFALWQLGVDVRWRERIFMAVELIGCLLAGLQLIVLFA
ncbi:MAG: hypothetical protein ACOCZK_07305 [Planctomycetota bacterium]